MTGSQYLLEAGGRRVLVDCGMFQGEKALRLRNWADPEFDPAEVDAMVLTHTHLDHIGRVPRLVKQGFRGPIYCTPPTKELAEILLLDAAHLQKEDAEYLNRKGLTKHDPALPLFDEADVQAAIELFRPVPLGRPQEVNHAFSLRLPRRRPPPRAPPPPTSRCARTAARRASSSAATWAASTPS